MKAIDRRKSIGFVAIVLILLATTVSAEETESEHQVGVAKRWNPSFVYGTTSFIDSDPHRTLGATFRIRLTNRLSVEPEFHTMSLPSREWSSRSGYVNHTHSDSIVAGHLVYDFRDEATKRVIPYVMGGVGWLQVRDEYAFTPIVVESSVPVFPAPSPPQPSTSKDAGNAFWCGSTFGVRIMIRRGFFVSPEVRFGYAKGLTGSAVIKVGYGF